MSVARHPTAHVYRGVVEWVGAAAGAAQHDDTYSREFSFAVAGKPLLTGSADVPFRGDARRHNPEDLLLGALSACHLLSYLAVCARSEIAVVQYTDDAQGTLTFVDGKLRFSDVLLRPRVVIAAGDVERAVALHARAHAECFIANSVNFPVRHQATVERH